MGLIFDEWIILVEHMLLVPTEKILLQHLQQLFDKSAHDSSRFSIFDTHRVEQDLHKALQLVA